MSPKTHTEIMEFLWITISATIFVLLIGSQAMELETLKTISETFCPEEWHAFGEFCYKGFSEKRNFENAEKECQRLGGHLAASTSSELQEFLTAKVLLPQGHRSYIGLIHNDTVDKSQWTDGSELQFFAWDANEPSRKSPDGSAELCIEMTFNDILNRLGKWNDISCNQELPYICQKRKDPATDKPEREPGHCWWTLDGIYFRNTCFHFSLHLKTWEEAEKYCEEHYNGHLASVTDAAVQKFLNYEVENNQAKPTKLWIGLKLMPDEIALWSSGWYMGYSHWKSKGKREDKVSSESCAAMTRGGSGEWTLGSCDEHLAFICENSSVVPPPKLKPSVPGLKCPSEKWMDLGGDYCYSFYKQTWVSWYEANFLCMRKGGTLASIHSKEEEQVLAQFFRLIPDGVHIGFFRHDRNEDTSGEFEWADGSPVNYLNWRYGEPNSKEEMCTEAMPKNDMKWNDYKCDSSRMFMCSILKNGSLNSSKETSCDAKENKCTACLPTPAIVGVVVCVLVVIILLGVVLYNVKPWMNARQQEFKNRKSSFVHERPRYRNAELVISEDIYENVDKEIYENISKNSRTTSFP